MLSRFFTSSSMCLSVLELREEDVVFTWPNRRMAELFGLAVADLAGKTWRSLGWPDQEVGFWVAQLRRCRDAAGTISFDYAWPLGDSQIWLECTLNPLEDNNSDRTAFGFSAVDVTHHKQAQAEREQLLARTVEMNEGLVTSWVREKELMELSERHALELSALLQSLPLAVSVFDARGNAILHNDAAMKLAGDDCGRSEGVAACRPARLMDLEGTPLPEDQWPVSRLLNGQDVTEEEYVVERADGSLRRMLATGRTMCDSQGNGRLAIIVSRDVTKQREMEKSREDFVHMVSHDLRTPLTAIFGYAQLLERWLGKAGANERQMQSIEAILVGARRMDAMIQDLVDSARLEAQQLRMETQPVALGPFLRDLLRRSSQALATDRVVAQVPDDVPDVLTDPNRLERILNNLLSNALRYSAPETPVVVSAVAAAQDVVVSVQDQGVGIAAEEMPHVFDRFFRTRSSASRPAGGLGLGLYITRMLVEAQGGRIWLESQPGKGSIFHFSLPVAAGV